MLIPTPPKFRRRRSPAKRTQTPAPPPAALTLVAAEYESGDWVRLTFDRAIDIAAIDGSQVIVEDDDETGSRFDGSAGASLIAPATVQLSLNRIGTASESGTHLLASESTGIVAVGDGGTWVGVEDLGLPFP